MHFKHPPSPHNKPEMTPPLLLPPSPPFPRALGSSTETTQPDQLTAGMWSVTRFTLDSVLAALIARQAAALSTQIAHFEGQAAALVSAEAKQQQLLTKLAHRQQALLHPAPAAAVNSKLTSAGPASGASPLLTQASYGDHVDAPSESGTSPPGAPPLATAVSAALPAVTRPPSAMTETQGVRMVSSLYPKIHVLCRERRAGSASHQASDGAWLRSWNVVTCARSSS